MSCENDYKIDNYPICSGNGICNNNKCHCNEGWTSVLDFQLRIGYDCDINILGIRIQAGINMVVSFILLLLLIRRIIRHPLPKIGKFYDTKYYMSWIATLMSLCVCLTGTLKLIDPVNAIIGSRHPYGILVAIDLAIIALGVNLLSANFSHMVMTFAKGYKAIISEESKAKFNHLLMILEYLNFPLAIFFSSVSALMIILTPILPEYGDIFCIIRCVNLVVFSFFDIIRSYLSYLLNQELFLYINNTNNEAYTTGLNELYVKLTDNLKQRRISILLTMPINVAIISWYYIRRKFTYIDQAQCLLLMNVLIATLSTLESNDDKLQFRSPTENRPRQSGAMSNTVGLLTIYPGKSQVFPRNANSDELSVSSYQHQRGIISDNNSVYKIKIQIPLSIDKNEDMIESLV